MGAAPKPTEAVVRVGARELTIGALAQRLDDLTPLGLKAFGADRAAQLRGYLEQIIVPELLLDQAAVSDAALAASLEVTTQRDRLLGQALEHELSQSIRVDDAEVQRYFDDHRAQFERPAAILLWRILVDDTQHAREIIKECQGAKGVVRWRELSRERSLDKATNLRDGLLGFVRADGTTDVPQLQVDTALYSAASKVADGEIVKDPVPEGTRLAVVWRRGSRPASSVSLAQATPQIRVALQRDKTRDALETLSQGLRKQQLKQFHPEFIELVEYPLPTFTPRDAFPVPSSAASATLRPPTQTDRGLR
jgi:peptidyl-prolyl cis-trans isomerase C